MTGPDTINAATPDHIFGRTVTRTQHVWSPVSKRHSDSLNIPEIPHHRDNTVYCTLASEYRHQPSIFCVFMRWHKSKTTMLLRQLKSTALFFLHSHNLVFSLSTSKLPIRTASGGNEMLQEKDGVDGSNRNNVNNVPHLQSLAAASAMKKRGSLRYNRAWRFWSDAAMDLLQAELRENLPTPVDRTALRALSVQLGIAAEGGSMPSFEDKGARAGYAVDYLPSRTQMAADLLFISEEPTFLVETIHDMFGGGTLPSASASLSIASKDRERATQPVECSEKGKICRMTSLGGGPGFDFVAAALISTYCFQQQQQQRQSNLSSQTGTTTPTAIHATVLDYEIGWRPLVQAMEKSITSVLDPTRYGALSTAGPVPTSSPPLHTCTFGGCDITLPMSDPVNAQCAKVMAYTDLWICSYCVAENAIKLRQSDFVFFRNLFANVNEGALLLFTETTHRLWPELANVAIMVSTTADVGSNDTVTTALQSSGFDIAFPRRNGGKGKLGPQMILRKRGFANTSTPMMGEKELEQCKVFERDNIMQERRLQSGVRRQGRKVRGAK